MLKNLLTKLGQDAKFTISGGQFDALVDQMGGDPELIESFKCPTDVGYNSLYSEVINARTKPCPPPPIKQHPDYQKLVNSITGKVQKEFGCGEDVSGCNGMKRCNEYVPIIKTQEKKKCDDRLKCLKNNCDKQKQDVEEHWKRLYKKFMTKCESDKNDLNSEIKKVKNQLDCCKRQYNKCKNTPVTKHPDFESALKKEQIKLLEMIRSEQVKCRSGSYNLTQSGGEKKNAL